MKKMSLLFVVWVLFYAASAAALNAECENVAGSCTVSENTTECLCNTGLGSGSSSASGGEDGMDPPPAMTQEELDAMCETLLVNECGDKEPVLEEHCSTDQVELCEGFMTKLAALDANCDFDSGDTTTSTDAGTAEERPSEDPASSPPPAEPYEPNVWEMTLCCDELNDAPDAMGDMMDCFGSLADDDCDGAMACDTEEPIDGDPVYEGGGSSSGKEDTANGDADEQSAGADGEDDAAETDSAGSGSCQVSPNASRSISLFGIFVSLLP